MKRAARLVGPRPGLLIGFVALALVLLATFAYVIVTSQATSRREAERGFDSRATLAAQLTASLFTTSATSSAAAAAKAFGGRTVDEGALTSAAKKSRQAYILILDGHGKLIGASRGASAVVRARVTGAPMHIRAALAGRSSLSDELPDTDGRGYILEWALPFQTPYGRRVEVSTIDSALIFKFLGSYLARTGNDEKARAYALDSQNRMVAAAGVPAKPGDRPDAPSLLEGLAKGPHGAYRDGDIKRYFVSAPVQGSSWRVVLGERTSELYPALAGSRSWFLFTLLGAFALAGVAGLLFFRRALQSGAKLATLNEELEHRAAELESQNTELELQSSELEDQQVRLETANEELAAQRGELEQAVAQLGEEKERVETFYGFAEMLTSETELDALGALVLNALCDAAEAELGTLYLVDQDEDDRPSLFGARGLDPQRLPVELVPGEGLAGRAFVERRAVSASHGETGLRLTAFGEDVAVHHELHLPLLYADRGLGVVTLARIADRPFPAADLEAIEHLAGQAAVAVSHALTLERARRQSAMKRAVLDATRDGIRLVDLEGRTLVANHAIEQITTEVLGLPADSTLYERSVLVERLTDPDEYRKTMETIAADPESETLDEFELIESRRSFARFTGPVRDSSGALIGRIIVVREVTDEREARRKLESAHAALEATQDGIGLTDLEGNVLVVNAAARRIAELHGVSMEVGAVGKDVSAAAAGQTLDPEAFLAETSANLADPERESVHESQIAGSGRSFQRYSGPFRDASGKVAGRIFTIRETTREREIDKMKDELLSTVSHELRTPLASILGFSELLVERRPDEATSGRYLETIHKEAQRLTGLIDDFLDLQRIEQGGLTLELHPFQLDALLAEQVQVFSGQSDAHSLDVDLPEQPLTVVGERDRIAQVVANLISNAIKYSPEGGKVSVAAEQQNGRARVSITDSGLGIPADQQGQLFTKFFRVDSSDTREIGGTGLGLTLSREIVEAHSGRIGFESVEGEGSTFWFELPAGPRSNGASRPRVLVVEDDPAAAELIRGQLTPHGYEVEVVTTGEEALTHAEAHPPALVCLDIGLAGKLDGWQVLAALKARRATADVPVVVCSAAAGGGKAAALGAADCLTKPFSARRLRETLTRILPEGGGSLVLVVDDEDSVRRLVVETLSSAGLELREAADGEEALAAVAERKPDAIVLDLLMPKLDGFAVLERLQEDPETRTLPVVVLTGHRLSATERKSLKARAVSLLEKNVYSPLELRRLVDQALGQ